MSHIVELIFRRPIKLLLVILLVPILSLVVAYMLPRSYQSSATLWAFRRYETIGATGTESDLSASPASTQAEALTEALHIRFFALAVAYAADLSSTLDSTLRSDSQLRDDALYNEISTNVHVDASGYNSFKITYTNQDAIIAKKVVDAVIQNYALLSQNFSSTEGERLLEGYLTQLEQAKEAANAAAATEAQYLTSHPDLAKEMLRTNSQYVQLVDPHYALLHLQTVQAQTTVSNIQDTIATLKEEIASQGSGADSLFKVLDSPEVAYKPISRVKLFLIASGIGFALAISICALYIAIAARLERVIYTKQDFQAISEFPIIMEFPRLSTSLITTLV